MDFNENILKNLKMWLGDRHPEVLLTELSPEEYALATSLKKKVFMTPFETVAQI
jgi:hypothetical protein